MVSFATATLSGQQTQNKFETKYYSFLYMVSFATSTLFRQQTQNKFETKYCVERMQYVDKFYWTTTKLLL